LDLLDNPTSFVIGAVGPGWLLILMPVPLLVDQLWIRWLGPIRTMETQRTRWVVAGVLTVVWWALAYQAHKEHQLAAAIDEQYNERAKLALKRPGFAGGSNS
jgi:hypothetical protein